MTRMLRFNKALSAPYVDLKPPDAFSEAASSYSLGRVAIYLDSLQGYGADGVIIKLANGLAAKGIHVDLVLAKRSSKSGLKVHPNVRIFDLKSSRHNILKNLFGLIRYLGVHKPNILFSSIHFNNVTAALALVIATLLFGVKSQLVVRQANTLRYQLKSYPFPIGSLLGFCTRLAYKRADLIISQSKGMNRDLKVFMKADARKIKLIYNPTVTSDIFEKAQRPTHQPWFDQKSAPILLAGGRLKPQKDFMMLLQAFAKVKQVIPEVRLAILGEGPQRQQLEELAKQLGVADSVQLIGFQKNPYAFLAMADVFVLSSQYEGLPNILIEALALGKKIVATDCESGPAEILKYGKYGRLVPVGDPDQMADALIDALQEPACCLREPTAVEDFDQSVQVEKYIEAFCWHLWNPQESVSLKAPQNPVLPRAIP